MDALQAKTSGTEIQTKQEKENGQHNSRFGYCTRPRRMSFCTEDTKVNRIKVEHGQPNSRLPQKTGHIQAVLKLRPASDGKTEDSNF